MKYIIFEQENKKLGLIIPTDGNLTSEEIAKNSLSPNTNYSIINELNIDNYFFDAYEYVEGQAVVNYEKAKEIQINKWRDERKLMLEKLDVDYMKALEIGDLQKQKEISEKKQELREITNTVMINDLEMIKNTWPNILNA